MSARQDILDRIRSALRDGPEAPVVRRSYRQESGLDEPRLIELLVDRLIDYKAEVTVLGADEVPGKLAQLLAASMQYAVPHGLDDRWLSGLVGHEGGPRRLVDGPERRLSVAELDDVDAVVTGCAVAVAETGTIILDGSPDQGRRLLTLVPDRHICLVKASDIVGILPEALRRLDPTRPLTWISGPSATSDIELERVEGVHGPRRLEVLILR